MLEAAVLNPRQCLQEKDDKEKAELDQARQVNRETANAFHAVRQQRAEAYMKAFDHIKDVINPIYKDLTKSSVRPLFLPSLSLPSYASNTGKEDSILGIRFLTWLSMTLLSACTGDAFSAWKFLLSIWHFLLPEQGLKSSGEKKLTDQFENVAGTPTGGHSLLEHDVKRG